MDKFEFTHFEIKSFNYHQTTSQTRTKAIKTHVVAQLGKPKDETSSQYRILLNVSLGNSQNDKDKLLLDINAVAYFVCSPKLEDEVIEEYIKHEVFPLAYMELAERVKDINRILDISYIELPAYDNSDE